MIAVVGIPRWRPGGPGVPAGRACTVALAAARAGARVELVGRIGDDPDGDALLISLARAGVGHVAVMRDPARATPREDPVGGGAGDPEDELVLGPGEAPPRRAGAAGPHLSPSPAPVAPSSPPVLEPADVDLALRYLPAIGVLVVTDDVPIAVRPVTVEAAEFALAHLVVLLPAGAVADPAIPPSATVLGVPDDDLGDGFAAIVGAFAAALDSGRTPADAFARATATGG